MSMPISHPWLARRSSANARREGGQQVREQLSPSWLRAQAGDRCHAGTVCASGLPRRVLSLKELRPWNSRGVFCRACANGAGPSAAKWQPGRERPPLPPSGPGPEPVVTGVAHAPAACLVCPDEVVRARAIHKTGREFPNRQSDGHVQHVEIVAAVVHVFLNRRVPCH